MKLEPISSSRPRRVLRVIAALTAAIAGLASAAPSTTVVISQVYGGGGNSGAPLSHDFVELHNISSVAQDIGGWSVQYAAATNNSTTWNTAPLTGSIPAGGYYLIQMAGGAVGVALPAPDATGSLSLAAANGKVALVNSTVPLNGLGLPNAAIVDFVGFGTANAFEGSAAAPAPSNSTSISRLNKGSTDTNDNAADFVAGAPAPRNSASPPFNPDPGTDLTAPGIASLTPANAATGVALGSALAITFNEDVILGTGSATLKKSSDNSTVETFGIPGAGAVLAGRALTLTTTSTLAESESYYVEISVGALADLAGNPFPGISGSAVWSFTMAGPDVTGPQIVTTSPVTGAVNVAQDTELIINYDEELSVGSGNILVKNATTNATLLTLPIADESQVLAFGQQVVITPGEQLPRDASVYVEIPAGAFLDALGNPSPAVGGGTWAFTTVLTPPNSTIVVNKLYNSGTASGDMIELLVIGDGIAGSTLDLRGMIIKDFSSSGNNDGGGKYLFNDLPFWSAVPVGTLITLTGAANTSADLDAGDFTLSVGLADPAYFTAAGGAFDVGGTDLVVIKAAGSDPAGVVGAIHGFSVGAAGTQYKALTSMRLQAGSALNTGLSVFANNATSSIADYDGAEVSAPVALASVVFGAASNGSNAVYLSELRGTVLGVGDGRAVVVNATPSSPFAGREMFGRGLTGQSAVVSVTATIEGVTLSKVNLVVPSEFGTPAAVTLSGPAAAGAVATLSGQQITITGASVTTSASLQVTLTGLVTPTPSLVTDNGNYGFRVFTAPEAGTPAATATPAMGRVIIPIASLRDVTATGVAVDLNATVAVSGVVTMGNFGSANTQAFIQDATGGINVFSAGIFPSPLVRGTRVAVVGTLIQFNGLTEISFTSADNVVELPGATVEPEPLVLTIPDLLAAAETHEGSLVKVNNLVRVNETDTWAAANTVRLKDASGNILEIRIQGGSGATIEPAYPVSVTGVLSQFDSSSPYTSGYQLQPRDSGDLEPGSSGSGFAAWATAKGIAGQPADGDFDNDGLSNLLEYALGLNPKAVDGSPGTLVGKVLSFTKGADAAGDSSLIYQIETSTTLAPDSWTPAIGVTQGPGAISFTFPAGPGPRFARLAVLEAD